MTTGEKLAALRKKNNYTQEQLAEVLGVSRQAISKWESDLAFPETEKLIKISSLYDCSLDYLLKDEILTEEKPQSATQPKSVTIKLGDFAFERKSEKMIKGVPLWHINIGFGRVATGIFSFGLVSRGVFSCGMLSLGVFSFGLLSLGLIAGGTLALGLIALGSIAVGALAIGGAANAVIGAYGDSAASQTVAIGKTEAYGGLYDVVGDFHKEQHPMLITYIDSKTPAWLSWAAELFKMII